MAGQIPQSRKPIFNFYEVSLVVSMELDFKTKSKSCFLPDLTNWLLNSEFPTHDHHVRFCRVSIFVFLLFKIKTILTHLGHSIQYLSPAISSFFQSHWFDLHLLLLYYYIFDTTEIFVTALMAKIQDIQYIRIEIMTLDFTEQIPFSCHRNASKL